MSETSKCLENAGKAFMKSAHFLSLFTKLLQQKRKLFMRIINISHSFAPEAVGNVSKLKNLH